MKTINQTISLYSGKSKRQIIPVFRKFFLLLNTICAFAWRSKSTQTGSSGAAALSEGRSTFGGTGRLYPLHPQPVTSKKPMLCIYSNQGRSQKNSSIPSMMLHILTNNCYAK
jgi:hypothetical protein